MITKIEVDGFKSLSNFELQLNKGLNVLVGTNGAGKTNIIQFFEFLSQLVQNNIGGACNNFGGAGTIFQKNGAGQYKETISAKIYGCAEISNDKFAVYEYLFSIKLSKENDSVVFEQQEVKLTTVSQFINSPQDENYPKQYDVHICSSANINEQQGKTKVCILTQTIKNDYFQLPSHTSLEEEIERLVSLFTPSHQSIIKALNMLTLLFSNIEKDLKGGIYLNITPSKVVELEDATNPLGIAKDGAGLAATLYAMKKHNTFRMDKAKLALLKSEKTPKIYHSDNFNRVLSFLQLANSTISGLDVEIDSFSNKLLVKVSIGEGEKKTILPLSAMSDGTIKWLTLITAILKSDSIASIEEPENYLHPYMQTEIIKIIREHLADSEQASCMLLTTHSESLLNSVTPEEVIIVRMIDGCTRAKQVTNTKNLKVEISNSAMGLGHFYYSNTLLDE
ncbi:MAG: AAA family ATPase [Bacteroidales bacterium]